MLEKSEKKALRKQFIAIMKLLKSKDRKRFKSCYDGMVADAESIEVDTIKSKFSIRRTLQINASDRQMLNCSIYIIDGELFEFSMGSHSRNNRSLKSIMF